MPCSRRFGRPRLGRGFLVMSGLLVVLVVAGLSGIELHRVAGDTARARSSPSAFAASAAYGAIVLTAAAWAVVAILSLAGSACAKSRDGRGLL